VAQRTIDKQEPLCDEKKIPPEIDPLCQCPAYQSRRDNRTFALKHGQHVLRNAIDNRVINSIQEILRERF
jgi:hypothetical protein